MQNFKLINFIALALVSNKKIQFFAVELCAYMRPIISYKELLPMTKWWNNIIVSFKFVFMIII